jgi:hypothetical protein
VYHYDDISCCVSGSDRLIIALTRKGSVQKAAILQDIMKRLDRYVLCRTDRIACRIDLAIGSALFITFQSENILNDYPELILRQ